MKHVELLAPAGDMEKLKTAIDYGADAVYLGGSAFGLRKASKNFGTEELREAISYVHERGKKLYVTMNIIGHDDDIEGVEDYAKELESLGVDALIVADPGMFQMVKRSTNLPIHMSTQASITNAETVKFWGELGAERVVLARELSLEEIREIHNRVGDGIELETFVHGAMCMSYSGRCVISNYMTGRDANLGDCAQPCRYKYALMEEKRPGEYFPVVEGEDGTFLFNSKDLSMISHLRDLVDAGVVSLKIEGRVKSAFYIATVVRAYRHALDALCEDPNADVTEWVEEVEKVSHRAYTTGFYYGHPKDEALVTANSSYIRPYAFVGRVLEVDEEQKRILVEQRNRLYPADEVEIFGPGKDTVTRVLGRMYNEEGDPIEVANVARQRFFIAYHGEPVRAGDLIRKREDEE